MGKKERLKDLPSVDEVLKGPFGEAWLRKYPRRYVLEAVREGIDRTRRLILEGESPDLSIEAIAPDIGLIAEHLSSLSLIPLINATGIVIHTNLGRAALSERAIENIRNTASSYSNLEYDLASGKRGKRYSHLKRLLREVTGAEDGIAVNNNAGAVLLCLSAFSRGKEAIVSRGELVEIGGSFRIPDVMAQSGAVLREVGATNKTHLYDYENAINENTALILKVHRSNYRVTGFAEDVPVSALSGLAGKHSIPVMHDLGSGCLIDLKPYGIHDEPTVGEALREGADIVTFSGDKLLGGPQAGIIVGKKEYIERVQKNPLLRALRIDKLTLSALEATLMEYIDEEKAKIRIPVLRMLLEEPERIKARAKKIADGIRRHVKAEAIEVLEDFSQAGGGALPGVNLRTFVVSIKSKGLAPNKMEERLRLGRPPVIGRIKEERFLLDARTVQDEEVKTLIGCLRAALL
ncbi:MAG: L-seryl-tRNA(Sec) selenium transferase [Thermodesulfovibrionales bacterium]|nr:L-seryl-tRNA(Sec) selenium transferase [Thermodesulfovibrionales bacterium]